MRNYLIAIFICSLFFVSIESQAQWTSLGLSNNLIVNTFLVDDQNIFAGTSNGVYVSNNNGLNWMERNSGLWVGSGVWSMATNGSNIFAALLNGGLFLSSNNGLNWNPASNGLADGGSSTTALAVSGSNVYAGGVGIGVFLSTDNGANWTAINNGFPTNTYVTSIAIIDTKIFVGTRMMAGTYVSTNNGASWNSVSSAPLWINSFAIKESTIIAGSGLWGIAISTDYGTTWSNISIGLNNTNVHSVVISSDIFFAGTEGGVFISQNKGASWKEVNSGLSNISVLSLASNGSYLFAGTNGSGVWRRPISEMITDIKGEQDNLPTEFKLEQNYPNPFNPTTAIRYQLSAFSKVTLKVHDLLGREVATLVDEEKSPGNYEVKFDGTNLASGVYFCQLQAGGFVDTKKIMLLK